MRERDEFPPELPLKAGEIVTATGEEGDDVDVLVKEVRGNTVVVDFNHPLAGQTLPFAVTVRGVRAPTAEQLEHGQMHGEVDGHDHDDEH